jgi:hypothetical protein
MVALNSMALTFRLGLSESKIYFGSEIQTKVWTQPGVVKRRFLGTKKLIPLK